MPYHLLFPLFSSVVFVFGMMLVKQAIDKGVSPWTGTFLGNSWLAIVWALVAVARGEVIPASAWGHAAIIGVLFVLGQVFTYLAFQYGDVSVATPIFGVKVLMVAGLVSVLTGDAVPIEVWAAGAMATVGIVLIQWSGGGAKRGSETHRRLWLTVALALSSAFCLSLFDVCVQKWAADLDSYAFLPVMFGVAGVLSLMFLPRVDPPKRWRELKATRWILGGTILMALQATSMCFSLAEFGDAARINIVYALRGLWGVLLAWMFARQLQTNEASLAVQTMLRRLAGAVLLTIAVLMAVSVRS